MGNLRLLAASSALTTFIACAHEPERRSSPQPAAAPAPAPAAPGAAAAEAPFVPDADGDGLADAADPCPLEPAVGSGCPAQYGYFFLRVIDGATQKPVEATLAFEPVVNRIVTADDGFAGTLAPGRYRLHAESPGYAPAELEFEIEAEHKAVVEMRLERREAP